MKSRIVLASLFVLALTPPLEAAEKVSGYAEYLRGDVLIVDGQRVRPGPKVKLKGVKSLAEIAIGNEVKARGERGRDGVIVAATIEAKPNGVAMFEREILEASDRIEQVWVKEGRLFDQLPDGRTETVGEIVESGPRVERVRAIMSRLVPPYVSPDDLRVRVVETEEWNASAMGNGAIWVYSGLMDAMSDDELAIVLGHELAHYTHEHSRRNAKKGMWTQIVAMGAIVGAEAIESDVGRTAVQLGTLIGASTLRSGYSRDLEDQADRVGLRYVYEAGYDSEAGPRLWGKFREKYGETDQVQNFLFGSHSRPSDRIRNIERELALNYRTEGR